MSKYVGLIDAEGFTALCRGDTMEEHIGWAEFVDYRPSLRCAFEETILVEKSGRLQGFFVTDCPVKGGTSGQLLNKVIFNVPVSVEAGKSHDIGRLLVEGFS